jgi:hypothetical protein|tara:strand:- start:67 stop:207 length:141 start_codon:yes stop_codon:yes gene_type:complete
MTASKTASKICISHVAWCVGTHGIGSEWVVEFDFIDDGRTGDEEGV